MKAGTEHALQYNIVRALKAARFIMLDTDVMDALKFFGQKNMARFAYISHHKNMGYTKGQSDLIVGKAGKFYAIELKTKLGRQSPEQRQFQEMCMQNGLDYRIIRSIADVESFIAQVKSEEINNGRKE